MTIQEQLKQALIATGSLGELDLFVSQTNPNNQADVLAGILACNLPSVYAAGPALQAALAVIVDHAGEAYPHFESERGQADIAQADRALETAKGKDQPADVFQTMLALLERIVEAVTPIPDSESCYIPKLTVADIKAAIKAAKGN